MFTKPNSSNGVPIYVQVKEQIIHAIEKGAIQAGEQLPSVRTLAEELVINPNTVIKIYKELEYEGIIEIRHGAGAYVSSHAITKTRAEQIKQGTVAIQKVLGHLLTKGLTRDEIRRIVEAELSK
jgi:GntR family transcriptional regulator